MRRSKKILAANVIGLFLVSQAMAGVVPLADQALSAQDNIVSNGTFADWEDGTPQGWSVAKGAGRAASPRSVVKKGSAGGLELSGNKSTQAWNFVSQQLKVQAGKKYQLNFTAKALGIKREDAQFNNCYVGVFTKNQQGKLIGQTQATISSNEFRDEVLYFGVPKQAATTEIWIFLSMTGKLSVKEVSVKQVNPMESFDILVADMDRNYSYFEHKKVDWKALTEKYRARAVATDDPAKFVKVINKMLAELNDMHVWIINEGQQYGTYNRPAKNNFDFNVVINQLEDKKILPRVCLTGKTKEGFGYVLIESMSGINDQKFAQVAADIRKLFDTPGLIIDLRNNKGGNERIGQLIAGMFCENKQLYAQQKVRSGPHHSDFSEPYQRYIEPWRANKNDQAYSGPIVCLQGPRAVSSAEAFTLMMKSLPHCTNIGQPTRGASGNPQPVALPNGVEVWYSRWVAMNMDGQPFEDVGVQPDILIKHQENRDVTFAKAIEVLKNSKK